MPNWCTNNLTLTFNSQEQVEKFAKHIESTTVAFTKEMAIKRLMKLLLAGFSGYAKVDTRQVDVNSLNLPALKVGQWDAGVTTEPSALDHAYTELLKLIADDVDLTADYANTIFSLYAESGLKHIHWGDIPKCYRDNLKPITRAIGFDLGIYSMFQRRRTVADWWTAADTISGAEKPVLDFDLFVSKSIVSVINGFNGRLLHGSSTYAENNAVYGTKWNSLDAFDNVSNKSLSELKRNDNECLTVTLILSTAWSPCLEVSASMVENGWVESINHVFWEEGCCFCGEYAFEQSDEGELMVEKLNEDDIEYEDDPDDPDMDIVSGPKWLLDKYFE